MSKRVPANVQEQVRLSTIQNEVLKGPSDVPGGKALYAVQRMAQTLEQLWLHLNRQQHFSRLLATAEQLGLHRVQLPLRILQARPLISSSLHMLPPEQAVHNGAPCPAGMLQAAAVAAVCSCMPLWCSVLDWQVYSYITQAMSAALQLVGLIRVAAGYWTACQHEIDPNQPSDPSPAPAAIFPSRFVELEVAFQHPTMAALMLSINSVLCGAQLSPCADSHTPVSGPCR